MPKPPGTCPTSQKLLKSTFIRRRPLMATFLSQCELTFLDLSTQNIDSHFMKILCLYITHSELITDYVIYHSPESICKQISQIIESYPHQAIYQTEYQTYFCAIDDLYTQLMHHIQRLMAV